MQSAGRFERPRLKRPLRVQRMADYHAGPLPDPAPCGLARGRFAGSLRRALRPRGTRTIRRVLPNRQTQDTGQDESHPVTQTRHHLPAVQRRLGPAQGQDRLNERGRQGGAGPGQRRLKAIERSLARLLTHKTPLTATGPHLARRDASPGTASGSRARTLLKPRGVVLRQSQALPGPVRPCQKRVREPP